MKTGHDAVPSGQLSCRRVHSLFRNRFALRCGRCGRETFVRLFPFGKRHRARRLSFLQNTCSRCGARVCDECFLIRDDVGMIEGICRSCAERAGVRGKSTSEILKEPSQ